MDLTNYQSAASSEINDEKEDISLEYSIRAELNSLPPLSSSTSIYRFPIDLTNRVRKEACIPQYVSIGPLHHGKEGLKLMEEHKKRYLHDFLRRTEKDQLVNSLKDYIKIIRRQEEKLRSSYAELIGFSSDQFVKIVLVDAAFIIEFLFRFQNDEWCHEGDRIMNKPWMFRVLIPDLWILENQLPFFILEDLLGEYITRVSSTDDSESPQRSMIGISRDFITVGIMSYDQNGKKWEKITRQSSRIHVQHFLDLTRTIYLPLESNSELSIMDYSNIPSITELHQAGVKFKAGSTENMTDITFADGVLEIPKMYITPYALWNLENLIAFERCHCLENYISDYVTMLRCLISTPKDVELLVEYGVIDSQYTDREVSNEINRIAPKAFPTSASYYGNLGENLIKHYRSPWNKWKANLKQNYFNTPWTSISVIAAVVLLILTLIQTVCSILSVAFDKHSK